MSADVHELARCCWCDAPFVRGAVLGTTCWLCPTEACWKRQTARAMVVTIKGRPRHDNPNGNRRCRFVPLPRQVEAMEAVDGPAPYMLFGGARGGSKSRAMREIAHAKCLSTPHFRALLLRRTFTELKDNHLIEMELEAPELSAEFLSADKVLRYPNGSTLRFGHCETSKDAANYLSSEYDLIIFDELVTFELQQFLLIGSSARTRKEGVTPKVIAGTNPGGPQSHWVRSLFIHKQADLDVFPDYRPEDYVFIPSKLEDNPYLDKSYERKLLALPPELRKAYRDGDWDIFPGQYFPEWRKAKHVVAMPVPSNAVWYRAIDGGFVKPGAVLWIALWDGHAYVRHEWNPVRVLNSDQAKAITTMTREFGIRNVRLSVADTSLWTPEKDTGESAAETFARHGVPVVQASKERVNGWKRLREWLADAPDGKPWLMVHPDCAYLIRTLPSLISEATKPEDVDTDGEDHSADALRYFCMARPSPDTATAKVHVPAGSPAWVMQKLREKAARQFGRVA